MVHRSPDEDVRALVTRLLAQPRESEWLEFKHDNVDPQRIGRYISGLANSAALENRAFGYVIWGVEDGTARIVGTRFHPERGRWKNQDLGFALERSVGGEADFRFAETLIEGLRVVVLSVAAARNRPVECDGIAYVRVESALTELRRFPERQTQLWDILSSESFETGVALDGATGEQVLRLLDLEVYFRRTDTPIMETAEGILEYARLLKLVVPGEDNSWQVTNLGAILFARDLSHFPSIERRAIHIVQYAGVDRLESVRRHHITQGYACGFEGMLDWVKAILPAREVYRGGERIATTVFSDLLLREVCANALIHQSFLKTGGGPLIEIFSDRLEITNSGKPLLAADRLINAPPVSRNESVARLMRRMRFCEESGSGWDKIAQETELARLPSPSVEVDDHATRVVVYGPRRLTTMARGDRVRSVYFHACLLWARREQLTNASLRARFGIAKSNSAQVSRLLNDAISYGQIVLFDPEVGNRSKSYVPYWVRSE